jgi:hypothetical protein
MRQFALKREREIERERERERKRERKRLSPLGKSTL